jgi:hypothetical protein
LFTNLVDELKRKMCKTQNHDLVDGVDDESLNMK